MDEDLERAVRGTVLAFLERHWTELSLREASLLSPESIDLSAGSAPTMIKDTLTYS